MKTCTSAKTNTHTHTHHARTTLFTQTFSPTVVAAPPLLSLSLALCHPLRSTPRRHFALSFVAIIRSERRTHSLSSLPLAFSAPSSPQSNSLLSHHSFFFHCSPPCFAASLSALLFLYHVSSFRARVLLPSLTSTHSRDRIQHCHSFKPQHARHAAPQSLDVSFTRRLPPLAPLPVLFL